MKKRIIAAVLAATMLSSTCAFAAEPDEAVNEPVKEYAENEGTTRADVIVIKYRTYNGKKQYRRWNETKQVWVDPYWINF